MVHLGDWFSSHNFANMIPLNRSFYTQITPILNCCCSVDKFTRYRCFNASNKVVLSYWKAKGHIASASNQMFNWNFAKWFLIYFQADTLTRYSDTSSFLVYFIHFSFRRSTKSSRALTGISWSCLFSSRSRLPFPKFQENHLTVKVKLKCFHCFLVRLTLLLPLL